MHIVLLVSVPLRRYTIFFYAHKLRTFYFLDLQNTLKAVYNPAVVYCSFAICKIAIQVFIENEMYFASKRSKLTFFCNVVI